MVIAVVLHRVSRVSIDNQLCEDNDRRDSDPHILNKQISVPSIRIRPSGSSLPPVDIVSATKRRTSAQVTRMLLAVTLTLIICNIPNTIFFVFVKLFDTRQLLAGRTCRDVSDNDITLYKFGFYSSVIQDILSDLPHIVNFFLYCLAGRKFRSIFINEVHQFLLDLHLIKQKQRRFTQSSSLVKSDLTPRTRHNSDRGSTILTKPSSEKRKSVAVLFNGSTTKTLLNQDTKSSLRKKNHRYTVNESSVPPYTSIQ